MNVVVGFTPLFSAGVGYSCTYTVSVFTNFLSYFSHFIVISFHLSGMLAPVWKNVSKMSEDIFISSNGAVDI